MKATARTAPAYLVRTPIRIVTVTQAKQRPPGVMLKAPSGHPVPVGCAIAGLSDFMIDRKPE